MSNQYNGEDWRGGDNGGQFNNGDNCNIPHHARNFHPDKEPDRWNNHWPRDDHVNRNFSRRNVYQFHNEHQPDRQNGNRQLDRSTPDRNAITDHVSNVPNDRSRIEPARSCDS